MAITYIPIASTTVGAGGTASIAFSGIPQTYTDLKLVLSLRVSGSATGGVNCYIAFNGSASNISSVWIIGTGSAVNAANRTDAYTIEVNSAAQTSSTFSNGEFYFVNYRNSFNKGYNLENVVENNATAANTNLVGGLWSSTSAITSIELVSGSGNFVQYSTAYLYGITNA